MYVIVGVIINFIFFHLFIILYILYYFTCVMIYMYIATIPFELLQCHDNGLLPTDPSVSRTGGHSGPS